MWCSNCHQESPGVAHATSGRIVCSRCQRPEKRKAPHATRICDDGLALDEPTPARANVSSAPFRADDWLLYAQDSPSLSGARGFSRGLIFTRDGTLVASVAQEGLVRERRSDPS